ncbi:hypothetical protein EMIHUDRAFT_209791 [Emiliania huxleyi CCMP1516]|uniref:J domain-containing protein n=2 Tax=Emiliania huxleyi TaxID=2903 RepID=A0A0D3J2S6_EMIH1|nr:hypothetical protein EMIHUDRAFT_209791 [Emiliania huxleyi CCMP1516]EOD17811.1 hypothetical protein EMIHUDRAFT_209791 [Emiliania huxleyi CCMP1516]|eukprot:XP_005770240.1 hypothetical protein EMIHUDRAFT_209791 [Emiliania huxleyi CCMP1516]
MLLARTAAAPCAQRLPSAFASASTSTRAARHASSSSGTTLDDGADPFAVLGLSRCATVDEARAAFHAAAMRHHPDRQPHADREAAAVSFRRATEAYRSLAGLLGRGGSVAEAWAAEERRMYDALRAHGVGGGGGESSARVTRRVVRRGDGTLTLRVTTTTVDRKGRASSTVEEHPLGGQAVWGDEAGS